MAILEKNSAGLVAFAESVLDLLERGGFVSTYKYAVLLGLIDLCMESTKADGTPRDVFTTRELAQKVIELYWSQTAQYSDTNRVLLQNKGAQARILADICAFRDSLQEATQTLHRARLDSPAKYERLLSGIEWNLIHMPLPRLQRIGRAETRLLYDIGWGEEIEREKGRVSAYQSGLPGAGFDNSIRLLPGVAEKLVLLNGLLRPLVRREWAAMVARINRDVLGEAAVEEFLFGADRKSLGRVRPGLVELQSGRCFYCGRSLGKQIEVDHFIPWSRYADDAIQNLVAADKGCNAKKKNFIAAVEHLTRWVERNAEGSSTARQLVEIAQNKSWESHAGETMGVARSIYLRLREGTELWLRGDTFIVAEIAAIRRALLVA
jgi:hypothetical protein